MKHGHGDKWAYPCFFRALIAETDVIGKEKKQDRKPEKQDEIEVRWNPLESHEKLLSRHRIKTSSYGKI